MPCPPELNGVGDGRKGAAPGYTNAKVRAELHRARIKLRELGRAAGLEIGSSLPEASPE